MQGFQNSGKGWEGEGIRNFTDIFLLGEGNLRRSDFDNLSSFQS